MKVATKGWIEFGVIVILVIVGYWVWYRWASMVNPTPSHTIVGQVTNITKTELDLHGVAIPDANPQAVNGNNLQDFAIALDQATIWMKTVWPKQGTNQRATQTTGSPADIKIGIPVTVKLRISKPIGKLPEASEVDYDIQTK